MHICCIVSWYVCVRDIVIWHVVIHVIVWHVIIPHVIVHVVVYIVVQHVTPVDRDADFLANLKVVDIQMSVGVHDFSYGNIVISAEQVKGIPLFYSVYNTITLSAVTDISEIIVIHYIASDRLNYAVNTCYVTSPGLIGMQPAES